MRLALPARRWVISWVVLLLAILAIAGLAGCRPKPGEPPPSEDQQPPATDGHYRPGDKVTGEALAEADWPQSVRSWAEAFRQSTARPLATALVVGGDLYFLAMPARPAVFRSLEWTFGASEYVVVIDPVDSDQPPEPLVARIPRMAEFSLWFRSECPLAYVRMVADRFEVGPGVFPADKRVAVVSPDLDGKVALPVHLTGYAIMPASDIGFLVRDPEGNLLAEVSSSTSVGEPYWGSFAVDLDFTPPAGGEVVVEICSWRYVGGYAGPDGPKPGWEKVDEIRLKVGP